MYSYIPPTFHLFEFDDESLDLEQQVQREFSGWNGLVDQPAQEVSLVWRTDSAAVLVSTSGQTDADTVWPRLTAVHLALGSSALPIPVRPDSGRDTNSEIERLAATDEVWVADQAVVIGGSPAEVAVCDGFSLAYSHLGAITVYIAAVGIRPDHFKVRKVSDWTVYDIDATKPHPLSDLS